MRKFLLRIASKLSIWIGKVHVPYSRKLIAGSDYYELQGHIRIGDVLSTRTLGELSNPFIPGFWGHVAIVASDRTVVEATTHGVVETDLVSFMMNKDYISLCRPKFLTEDQCWLVADYCKRQIGKEYDYSFNTSDISKFYCSELVYAAIAFVIGSSPFKLREVLGVETVDPSDFYSANKLFDRIWHSQSCRGVNLES